VQLHGRFFVSPVIESFSDIGFFSCAFCCVKSDAYIIINGPVQHLHAGIGVALQNPLKMRSRRKNDELVRNDALEVKMA